MFQKQKKCSSYLGSVVTLHSAPKWEMEGHLSKEEARLGTVSHILLSSLSL